MVSPLGGGRMEEITISEGWEGRVLVPGMKSTGVGRRRACSHLRIARSGMDNRGGGATMRRGGVVEGVYRVSRMVGKGSDERGEASVRSLEC